MEESIQLLSTMSPRVKVKNNFHRKGPTFLALRQSLKRRSSVFVKRAPKPIKEDTIVIESSTESDDSTRLNNSFESAGRIVAGPDRMKDIERWINDIELEKGDSTAFNELSTILGASGCVPKERGDVVNSTFDWDKCKKINEFFGPKKCVQRLNSSDVISGSDRSLNDSKLCDESLKNVKLNESSGNKTEPGGITRGSEDIDDLNNVSSSHEKSIDSINLNKSESVDDIINITSTSEEKSLDKLLQEMDLNKCPNSLENRDGLINTDSNEKSTNELVYRDLNKSSDLDDEDIINITSSLEEESIGRLLKNIDLNKPNRLEVFTIHKNVTVRKRISRKDELLSVASIDDKENEQSMKGISCSTTLKRDTEHSLPKTEPIPRELVRKPKDTHSEKRSKSSIRDKRSNLNIEETESNSLRQNLFRTKAKLFQDSSSIEQKSCDSESEYNSAESDRESDNDDLLSANESDKDTKSIQDKSWKAMEAILPKTEPRPSKLVTKLRNTHSDKRCKTSSNLDKETKSDSFQQNLFQKSPLVEVKKSYGSESANSDSESENADLSANESSNDDQVTESIQVKSWSTTSRKDIEAILPKTEPRPSKLVTKLRNTHSDKISKTSSNLDKETTKSDSLQQNLFQKSRLVEVKKSYDSESANSDSESENADLVSANESSHDDQGTKSIQGNSCSTTSMKAVEHIVPKTGPRRRKIVRKPKDAHSEIQPKTTPNLYKETKKSCNSESDFESANSDSKSDKDDLLSTNEKLTKTVQGNSSSTTSRKAVETIVPQTEPRQRKIVRNPKDAHSEIQPRTSIVYKNPYLDTKSSCLRQNLFKTSTNLVQESPFVSAIKKLCDSDSDSGSANSDTELNKADSFSDSESSDDGKISEPVQDPDIAAMESILDEAYGEAWRKNRDQILPRTEPKPRNRYKLPNDPICSERKHISKETVKSPHQQEVRRKLFDTPVLRGPQFTESDIGTAEATFKRTPTKKSYTFLESLSASVPLYECDPSARIFRGNFKAHKDELTRRLHVLYNEKVFDDKLTDVKYVWSTNYRNTAGSCRYTTAHQLTGVTIILAEKVIDSPERLRDTLIHEMCHAATWIIDKVICNHGNYWKAWTFKAMTAFKELPPIKRCHNYNLNHKYYYQCEDCGHRIGRYSKSINVETQHCRRCSGKYELYINKKDKNGEVAVVPVTPTPKKPVTGFALFVKENYATYRSPGVPHAQVMQILGNKFREERVNK